MPTVKRHKHWLVLLACCGLSMFSVGLAVNTNGVFYAPVSEDIGVLLGTFSFQSTINLLGNAAVALFIPFLLRRTRYRNLIYLAVAGTVLTTFLMSTVRTIPALYILGAFRGLAAGLIGVVPLTMIINEWFERYHGLATSIVLSFSGIGGAIFSPIFARIIETAGWERAYMLLALVMLLICLPALLLPFGLSPHSEGLAPYGAEDKPDSQPTQASTEPTPAPRDPLALITLALYALLGAAVTGVVHHFPGFAPSLGHSATMGALMLSVGMLANIAGKLILGWLSDRIGVFKASVLFLFLVLIAGSMLLTLHATGFLLLAAVLFGSCFAIATVSNALLTRRVFGARHYGDAYAIVSFAGTVGAAFAMSLIGYVYDFTGSYMTAVIISLGFCLLNLLFLAILARRRQA